MLTSTAINSTPLLDSLVAPISTPLLDSLVAPITLAKCLGTTERSLSEWRIKGRGPKFIRVGRSVRYRPEAVDAWLLANEHSSTSEEVL
ncbi:DNA-binding protein [Arthrobacter livingstonensis]|uniref:DNA-binding protein n=1 Tax=Arthrobacter livingstonensis TaxID=670078 RepID=A0A2V5LFY1_9MICC|nr:DNA-binding protein [Arthrobacter livingstonensis]